MKRVGILILSLILLFSVAACSTPSLPADSIIVPPPYEAPDEPSADSRIRAVFGGVHNKENALSENKDSFEYIFYVDGKAEIYTLDIDASYSLHNTLKVGYEYLIEVDNNKVISADNADATMSVTASAGVTGEKTITNLLKTALAPVGKALYVYGGGWNWQDTAGSREACTIGVLPYWTKFFASQDASYAYRNDSDKTNSFYPYGGFNEYYFAGLDCSGYIGWVLYNVMHTGDDYVMGATKMAKTFADRGFGTWSQDDKSFKPGDIISMNGHVWLCLGTCDDGSVVILHSTPSPSRTGALGGGVQISALGSSSDCEAYALADHYMKTYFPDWYKRYPAVVKSFSSYTDFSGEYAGKFSWNGTLTDPDSLTEMSANDVLTFLFK